MEHTPVVVPPNGNHVDPSTSSGTSPTRKRSFVSRSSRGKIPLAKFSTKPCRFRHGNLTCRLDRHHVATGVPHLLREDSGVLHSIRLKKVEPTEFTLEDEQLLEGGAN